MGSLKIIQLLLFQILQVWILIGNASLPLSCKADDVVLRALVHVWLTLKHLECGDLLFCHLGSATVLRYSIKH